MLDRRRPSSTTWSTTISSSIVGRGVKLQKNIQEIVEYESAMKMKWVCEQSNEWAQRPLTIISPLAVFLISLSVWSGSNHLHLLLLSPRPDGDGNDARCWKICFRHGSQADKAVIHAHTNNKRKDWMFASTHFFHWDIFIHGRDGWSGYPRSNRSLVTFRWRG